MKNKEKILNKTDEQKEKRKIRMNKYVKQKRKDDILFRLKHDMRSMIRCRIKKLGYDKNSRTQEILGCDFEFFKEYLEKQFETWMNWENRGKYNGEYGYGWDIDHIIEMKTVKTEEDVIRLNHYTNLRPLDSKINRIDRNYES